MTFWYKGTALYSFSFNLTAGLSLSLPSLFWYWWRIRSSGCRIWACRYLRRQRLLSFTRRRISQHLNFIVSISNRIAFAHQQVLIRLSVFWTHHNIDHRIDACRQVNQKVTQYIHRMILCDSIKNFINCDRQITNEKWQKYD